MNEMAYVLQTWLPLLVWRQTEAPQYQKGFITVFVLSLLLILTALVLKYLHEVQRLRYVYVVNNLFTIYLLPITHSQRI